MLIGRAQGEAVLLARRRLTRFPVGASSSGTALFWSAHYDLNICYVGPAEKWDRTEIDGRVEAKDCTAVYRHADRRLAVATIFRDLEGLRAEVELERTIGK